MSNEELLIVKNIVRKDFLCSNVVLGKKVIFSLE